MHTAEISHKKRDSQEGYLSLYVIFDQTFSTVGLPPSVSGEAGAAGGVVSSEVDSTLAAGAPSA